MKLKKKPNKPKRKTVTEKVLVHSGDTLSSFGNVPESATFEVEYDEYYCDAYFVWNRKETDEEFIKRMDSYNRRLSDYNKWYKENKEEIEQELQRRENTEREKLERKKEKLRRELKRLENSD